MSRRIQRIACWGLGGLLALLAVKSWWDLETPTLALPALISEGQRFRVLDRLGESLSVSYQNRFNTLDILPLHALPAFLRQAFIASEDQHFFEHHGVDWTARLHAFGQNLCAGKAVRGASTISEQVVRILHPRPRTLWSRWLEGIEALLLERRTSKGAILEFYFNQLPYAANRHGVAQAARYYFNRDVTTLTQKEVLALVVLPRAPSAFDLYKKPSVIEPAIARLAQILENRGELSPHEHARMLTEEISLRQPARPLNAAHFVNYVRETTSSYFSQDGVLHTTLDVDLQRKTQSLLDERIKALKRKQVQNGAALVVDHTTGEILAWAVGGAGSEALATNTPGHAIDAVRAPRQPGSALKPFLYALALDSGWSPATQLDDEPMTETIGAGLHHFHNYSHTFYGKIFLREALGNSLNIPALATIAFVGPPRYLDTLHALGFASLTKPIEFYKEGLALGNGEVSLYEMVQAYSALAHHGVFQLLTPLLQPPFPREPVRIYTEEAASLIANILSDPFARRREFGASSVLNLPVQTAIKTGTSTDYHDAWVLGFNSRYTVGVWMGNVDQTPMDGVTGSGGPALVLRGIFAELALHSPVSSLYVSPKLVRQEICTNVGQRPEHEDCFPRTEYFLPGTELSRGEQAESPTSLTLIRPTEGLQLAYDPRIPADQQAFEFVVDGVAPQHKVAWILNDTLLTTTQNGRLLWPVSRGSYTLLAKELDKEEKIVSAESVHFQVK